ncbi:Transcription elongation factor A protein 2 [Durusdinium trenchii]|uniref:Transcription elongation factor A protein 2 n=1 Tax=Durusdinium trenchii TaxID=1381693 RepID=A0ABP0RJF5_9DINO
MFDLFLVMNAAIEILLPFVFANMSFLRICRVFRLIRVVRLVRTVKWLRSLRTMLMAIIKSISCLLWAFVMILLVTFVFSIIFGNAAASYFETIDLDDVKSMDTAPQPRIARRASGLTGLIVTGAADDLYSQGAAEVSVPRQVQQMLAKTFNSGVQRLSGSVAGHRDFIGLNPPEGQTVSLFCAIFGGQDWMYYGEVIRDLDDNDLYFTIFLFYIGFCLVGLLNVITGIFVDSAVCTRTEDEAPVREASCGHHRRMKMTNSVG